jgi:multiple sugar transport system substrate-binding protein
LAIAAATVMATSACGGNSSSSAPTGKIAGTIQYQYWGDATRAKVTEAAYSLYDKAHPGVQVQGNVTDYNSYITRLTVQATGGTMPCVTQMQSTFLGTYADRGALRPLDDLIKSGAISVSGIPASALATGQDNGKQYMIPTGEFLRRITWNTTMAKKYGIPAPPYHPTFDQYRAWLVAAQAKLPKGVYAAQNEGEDLFTLYSWVAGHGEKMFSNGQLGFPKQTLADFLSFWTSLGKQGVAVPPDRIAEENGAISQYPMSVGTALSATADIPHIQIIGQTLTAGGHPSTLAWMDNPAISASVSGNVPGTNGLSISASCNNVSTTASFINYFANSPAAAVAFQSSNGVVVSASQQAAFKSLSGPVSAGVNQSIATLKQVLKANDLAPGVYPPGYQTLSLSLQQAFEAVALKGESPEQAASGFFSDAHSNLTGQ